MIVDNSTFFTFNIQKEIEIDLYVVSCFKNKKLLKYHAYTTYDEAKKLYEDLKILKIDIEYDIYLNKYRLNKNFIESSNNYFLNSYLKKRKGKEVNDP